jgi:ribosomal-protein-alanine N-acetyltransferase
MMRIRNATAADIPALRAVEAHASTAAHWREGTWDRIFDPGGLPRLALVLEEGAPVLAFVIVLCLEAEWEIENIAVTGNARRRGLGARLLGEVLDRARGAGAGAVFLEVRESNRAARALYEKWAFVQAGRRAGYYSDPPEDAILYRFSFADGKPGP